MRPFRLHWIPGDEADLERQLNLLTKWVASQGTTINSSPEFAGLTLTGLSGVLKATVGVVSGSASFDNLANGSSVTMRTNLNADLLDGHHSSDFLGVGAETDPIFVAAYAHSITGVDGTTIENTAGVLNVKSGVFQAAGSYQTQDADLDAIAALGFVSTSFLKKTALNTWALDTNVYLTAEADTLGTVVDRDANAGATINVGAGNTLVLATGSITDTTGAISFGNENLSTTGTLGAGAITGTSLTGSGLTSGRVPYISTGGLLTDSAKLTFDGSSIILTESTAAAIDLTTAGGTSGVHSLIKLSTKIGGATEVGGITSGFNKNNGNEFFHLIGGGTNSSIFGGCVSADGYRRFKITADGTIYWGSGAATQDTNLYRAATDILKTDDSFLVAGTLGVTGLITAIGGIRIPTTEDIQFRDSALKIWSDADGYLDVAADVGFRVNAPTIYKPSTTQAVTGVGTTILANATMIMLNPDADYTLTSAPTIADGTTGQILYISCPAAEGNTVTFQDQGTLAGSNLQLGATTRSIKGEDVLCLIFGDSCWTEVSYANNNF